MKKMVCILLSWFLFNSGVNIYCQSLPVKNFSVAEGLPSGIVYDCLQDKLGFMWFATEAGLARFDGTNFKVFTTEDGLTNNPVLQVFEDNDGSIMIFPFGKSPCLFDLKSQTILNSHNYPGFAKLEPFSGSILPYKIPGGIACRGLTGMFLIEGRKVTEIEFKNLHFNKPLFTKPDTMLFSGIDNLTNPLLSLWVRTDKGWKEEIRKPVKFEGLSKYQNTNMSVEAAWENKKIFLTPGGFKIFQFSESSGEAFSEVANVEITGNINSINRNGHLLNVCTTDGLFMYDLAGKLIKHEFAGESLSRYYIDKQGNEWLCTINGKGVYLRLKNGITNITAATGLPLANISALHKNNTANLITGDIAGNICSISFSSGKAVVRQLGKMGNKIREIRDDAAGGYIGITDIKIFRADDKRISRIKDMAVSFKSVLNEGNGFLAASAFSLFRIDRNLEDTVTLIPHLARVACHAMINETIYFGNTTGLYKIEKKTLAGRNTKTEALSLKEPITALYAAEGLLFAGTSTRGIYILRNGRIAAHIYPQGNNPDVKNFIVKRIFAEPLKKRIWASTNKGIQEVHYSLASDSITYKSRFITTSSGLLDNEVNDLALINDTIYAATIKGISCIPAGIAEQNVPLYISSIAINKNTSGILYREPGISYTLKHNQNNISISYNSINFTAGNNTIYEYRLTGRKRDSSWSLTTANTVEFAELQPGNYIFQVKTAGSAIQKLQIHIIPPFWSTAWFRILMLASMLLLIYIITRFYMRRYKRKQEQKMELNKQFAALELRALQSQMNPHFIFNSMNSLQNYILLNDTARANEYLSKFSALLRLFLDASRSKFVTVRKEIELLNLYTELEQKREIGSFTYRLNVDESIDQDLLIPSVLIQPFVENAIVHGLRYLEGKQGELTINIFEKAQTFICTIQDNGVGRQKAKEIQQNKKQQYQSYGTSIIQEKIETLRKIENVDVEVEMADIKNTDGETDGTIVTIQIKLQHIK